MAPSGDDAVPIDPPEVTVIVKTQHDERNEGLISQLTVITKDKEKVITDDKGEPLLTPKDQLTQLTKYLKEIRESLGNKDDVKLMGDSRLKWESVVKVRDACQQAGFVNAALAPPPDLGLRE